MKTAIGIAALNFENKYTADHLSMLYKRARMYGCRITFMSREASDILDNDAARNILANCDFLQILRDRFAMTRLARFMALSDKNIAFLSNAAPGEGLIYTRDSFVTFKNTLLGDKLYDEII